MILYSPVDMPGTLGMSLWRCGGGEEGGEEEEVVRRPRSCEADSRRAWALGGVTSTG